MAWQWQTPAWKLPMESVNRIELFSLPERTSVTEVSWPAAFWSQVGERILLKKVDTLRVIHLFRELEPDMPARCHMPPWGIALYDREALLFIVTLCYMCSNGYVYTSQGKDLRSFNPEESNAVSLRRLLEQYLPLSE